MACAASRPAGSRSADDAEAAGRCPADEPEPAPKPRRSGPRPFVEVVPREDVPVTPETPSHEVQLGRGIVCKAHEKVWRDEQGRIRTCTVARRVKAFGLDLAADAYSQFHADGRPYQTHIASQQELVTAAGEKLLCAADFVMLSKTGALEHCTLVHATVIGKVPCRAGESVAFHPGGRLAMAVLDQPMKIAGLELPAASTVFLFPSGALEGGWLKEPARIRGFLVSYEFTLHENGALHVFRLAEARTIQGQKLPERATVELRRDGSLAQAEFEVDQGFMPHGELWTDTKQVSYDCAGKVRSEYVEHYQAPFPPHPPRR